MSYADILVEREEELAIITLNRPSRLNAMRHQTLNELNAALDEIASDGTLKVVIITGAPRPDGRACFSSGGDVKEIAEKGPYTAQRDIVGSIEDVTALYPVESEAQLLMDRIESFSKPVIAAIDGVCTAGGLELALCCDLRVVSETAIISDLHLKNLGVLGGSGATVRLARAVGCAKAKEIVFTGEPLDGQEAWKIGLANRVVPPSRLMDEAKELGKKIAKMRSEGVRLAKSSINSSIDMGLHEALRFSYLCVAALTEDAKRPNAPEKR